jgi:hypothetical protein
MHGVYLALLTTGLRQIDYVHDKCVTEGLWQNHLLFLDHQGPVSVLRRHSRFFRPN